MLAKTLQFQPRIRVKAVAQDYLGCLHIVLHFFGKGAHINLLAVHHLMNNLRHIRSLASGDGN